MKTGTKVIIGILRWVLVLALAAFAALPFLGQKQYKDVDFETTKSALLECADVSVMNDGGDIKIKRLYGLDPSLYEGSCLYYPTSNMAAEEFFLIKSSDEDLLDAAYEAAQARLAKQKASFDGYGTNQLEMLENSAFYKEGGFVLFYCGAESKAVGQKFYEVLEAGK